MPEVEQGHFSGADIETFARNKSFASMLHFAVCYCFSAVADALQLQPLEKHTAVSMDVSQAFANGTKANICIGFGC